MAAEAELAGGDLAATATSMISDLDIYRAAKLLIDRVGEDTQLYAAARTVVLAGGGDEEGAAIWRQITAAIEELQRMRRPDEPIN
jgi:hypothetical protein